MAEFQSKFTGQEVENTIDKLRNWIAVDGTYPTVTISGITYAVIWKVAPVSGTACYGIGLHPTTGRPYEIYYNGSSYTATALDSDTKNTAGSTNSTSKLFLIGAGSQAASAQTYSNSAVYVGTDSCLYSNNTKVSVEGHTHGEAYLTWGGKNFSGSYGPIDAAMVPELGANRLAFMPADAVTVEYSRDGGATWTDYGTTDTHKTNLFNGNGTNFTIGKAASGAGNIATNQYQLRVNVYTSAGRVYTALNKFVLLVSTNGTNSNWCTIRARLQKNYADNVDTWTTFADKVSISGWSGYNVINTSGITTYGNTVTTQYGHIQFIFGCDTGSTNDKYAGLSINKIFGFGGVGWTTPSTMAKTGHMYTYDASQNVTFPATVKAKSFEENGTSLANKYMAKSIFDAAGDLLVGSGNDTYTRLAKGSNGTFLGVNSSGNVAWVSNPNTDTHYTKYLQIKGNGTEAVKYTQDSDKTLNLKPGNNVSISAASGEITISATDTNTWRGIQNNLTSDSTTDSLSAAQGKALKGLIDGKQVAGNYVTTDTVQSITAAKTFSTINSISDTDARSISTGTNANSYFQSRKFRGEGNAATYYHAVDFGFAGHNQVDFYECGGVWNFWKNTTEAATTADDNLCLQIGQTYLKNKSYQYDWPTASGTLALKSDIPTIPTVNNATLTIQKNGTNVATFTANSSTDTTANITVPTKVSELTNDSGFVTSSGVTSVATSGTGLSGGTITSTGTINLDSSSAGNAAADKVILRNAAGSIQTEKLAVSSGTTTKATMQYNATEDCIEFIFA